MRCLPALLPAFVIALAACRPPAPAPGEPVPVNVPDEAVAPAVWEDAWSPDELDAWREGVITDMPPGGNFRDGRGNPLEGATVDLLIPSPQGHVDSSKVVASIRTGPDGTFRVGPTPSGSFMLRVTKAGFTPVWVGEGRAIALVGVVEPTSASNIRIALPAAREAPGVAIDPAGKPVPGLRLVASAVAYREELTTDAEGRFTAHAPVGRFNLQPDDAKFDGRPVSVSVPEEGAAAPVSITVRPVEPLRGWVRTLAGTRIAGATVICAEDPSIRTRTGADGRFELRVGGDRHVAALTGGWAWRSFPVPRAGELEIWLDPAAGMSGTVTDAAGSPVPDARLYAVVIGFNGSYERVLGPVTRTDGTFDFSWLPRPPRGVANPVRIFARRRGLGESGIITVAADRTGAEANKSVALLGARNLSGRATRSDGTPVAGAVVTASWGHFDGGITPPEVAVLSVVEQVVTHTDADGRWRLASVPLGLHAKVRCAADEVAREVFVELLPPSQPIDFVFAGGTTLAGRVTAADGSAPEGPVAVTAQLLNSEGIDVRRRVDARPDGTFSFADLPPGQYQIRAEGEKYDLPGGCVADSGATDVKAKLERSATLTAHLKFEGGKPPEVPLEFAFLPAEGGPQEFRRTIEPGHGGETIVLRGIYPGRRRLEVAGDVWRAVLDPVEVADGARLEMDVEVRRTIRMAATVTDAAGTPLGNLLVIVAPVRPTPGWQQNLTSSAKGVLDITGLEPGRWRATATPAGVPPLQQEFDVKAGANPPLELRVKPCGTLVVDVVLDTGHAVPDAVVVLTDANGAPVDAWGEGATMLSNRFRTNADGRATVTGVRAGPVRVEVGIGPTKLSPVVTEVNAGRETAIQVK